MKVEGRTACWSEIVGGKWSMGGVEWVVVIVRERKEGEVR